MSGDPRVGTVLGDRYRLERLLGVGGMGSVYQAEHVLMRKRLAVKVLHRELTTVPEVVRRFEREAMAAAHIEHPNVAAATDFGKLEDGSVFLVLEYVEGTALRDEIAKGPMAIERALHIGGQIAAALAAAHEMQIVHRDLKPENVMLVDKAGDPDFVKVLDFGIAKVPIAEIGDDAEGRPITKAGMVFGTPEYMAPEQALGQPVDGRADLYGLGVIMFEMIAGMRPFKSKSQVGILGQQLSNPPPTFAERAPGVIVPKTVEQVVHCLLAKEADERYASAREAIEAIVGLLGETPHASGRLFTLTGGSPRGVLGSRPRFGSAPEAGALVPASGAPVFVAPPPPARTAGASQLANTSRVPDSGSGVLAADDSALGGVPSAEAATPSRAQPDPIGPGTSPSATPRANTDPAVRLYAFIDQIRGRLPGEAIRLLAPLSNKALLLTAAMSAGLLVLVVLGASIFALTSTQAEGVSASATAVNAAPLVPSGPPALAPDAELERATATGVVGLEELAARNPKDVRILLELAEARVKAGQHVQAVKAVSDALALDPSRNADTQVSRVLFQVAQAPAARDDAFKLLRGPMGTRGADIAYDLAATKGVQAEVRRQAEQYLKSETFAERATPELKATVKLRHATSAKDRCSAAKAVLGEVMKQADRRALPYLQAMAARTGCGPKQKADCYACLRRGRDIEDTIAAVEARHPSKKRRAP